MSELLNKIGRCFAICVVLVTLISCSSVQDKPSNVALLDANFTVELTQYQQSSYKQIEAKFSTEQSLQLVFRVISDLELTTQWFDYLKEIETLKMYSNNQFLLRSVINSPWPLTAREIITCVDTDFEAQTISIRVNSCSEKHPINDAFVRVIDAKSTWTLQQQASGRVLISYEAWLDPSGNIPALFYNQQLIDSTTDSFQKLIKLIEASSLNQYDY